MTKLENAILKVMESWKGTPEELGASVYTATTLVVPPGWDEADKKRWREELAAKRVARGRILACEGGAELLKLEEKR